jgi:hypothetical protein
VTVTAEDENSGESIISAYFRAHMPDGSKSEPMPMYNEKKPIQHTFAIDTNLRCWNIWTIEGYNLKKSPIFTAKCEIDLTKNRSVRFVVPKHSD